MLYFMARKNIVKIIIAIILIVSAVVFTYLYTKDRGIIPVANNKQSIESILEKLQTITFTSSALSKEDKEKYFERFQKSKEKMLQDLVAAKKSKDKNAFSLLYPSLMDIGALQRISGDYIKAEKAFLLLHEIEPGAFPPLGNLGDLYYADIKDYVKAEKYYLLAIQAIGEETQHSVYIDSYISQLYQIYRYRQNDEKKAENFLLTLTQKYPKDTILLTDLALHYRGIGNIPKARETYQKLLELNPDSVAAKQGLEELK